MRATVTNTGNRRESWPSLPDIAKNCPLTLDPGESAETDIPYDFDGHPHLAVRSEPPRPFIPVSVPSAQPAAEEPSDPQDQE
jgi:hypothetical protein